MNLPNKLTVLRVILIPFFLVALMVDAIPYGKWIAVGIFIIASLTDMLDGKIARKYNLITNFGKFMDPLADKLDHMPDLFQNLPGCLPRGLLTSAFVGIGGVVHHFFIHKATSGQISFFYNTIIPPFMQAADTVSLSE